MLTASRSDRPWLRNLFRRDRTAADLLLLSSCALAAIFLMIGMGPPVNNRPPYVVTLHPLDPKEPLLSGAGFAGNAVFPSTSAPPHEGRLQLYGSWLHTDASLGQVHWYPAATRLYIYVAGYPNVSGNQLFVEVRTASSGSIKVPFAFYNPGESWRFLPISLAGIPKVTSFRIVAIDGSTTVGGWLGFSLPFQARADNPYLLRQMLAVFLTAVAATLFFLAPGLLLRQKRNVAFIWIPFPGLLVLALVGLIAWITPHSVTPVWISGIALWILLLYATYAFWSVPIAQYINAIERRVLLVTALLIAIGTAKATYSLGPAGELFHDTISRTLEVGPISDSRLSYHVVQLIAFQKNLSALSERSFTRAMAAGTSRIVEHSFR